MVVVVDVVGDSDEVLDLGRVVVVVELVGGGFDVELPDDAFEVVVVVVAVDDLDLVVVVVGGAVDDFDLVVVVVDDVAAVGTLGSSLAVDSSRAWAGAPAAAGGGATAGGGIRSSRRAYCMIRAKTGADTCPP